jgi:hypothetical protein
MSRLKAGPELTSEKLVDALENIRGLDFGIGTTISFGPWLPYHFRSQEFME